MEERDVINVETEYLKSLISRMVCEILKRKKGYCVELKINRLNAVNDDERVFICLDMGMEADSEDLKRRCHNSTILKTVVSAILKLLCNKVMYSTIENIINNFSKGKVDIYINDFFCNEKEEKFFTYINANIKMKKEDIEYFLGKARLI